VASFLELLGQSDKILRADGVGERAWTLGSDPPLFQILRVIVNLDVDKLETRCLQLVVASSKEIRQWLVTEVVNKNDVELGSRAAEHFGITRQAVARHLRKLVDEGVMVPSGHTKARRYRLAVLKNYFHLYGLGSDFQEDLVWSKDLRPLLAALPENILGISEYGVTEILNNAKDHSEAAGVSVGLELTAAEVSFSIGDQGIGIFRKIKDACGLEDERHAILELVKGRLTTDPEHHTGEGIFFTSRAFDRFTILSGSLSLVHRRAGRDWSIDDAKPLAGTFVTMAIDPASSHTVKEVFDRYSTEHDDYAFRRTHLLLALAETEGGSLVSRSQAKRVMARCDRFREVVLDFRSIGSIGPAFADEIFRVWRRAHPSVALVPVGMNEDVEKMVRRALVDDSSGPSPSPGSET
jgi:biotin operon repressor